MANNRPEWKIGSSQDLIPPQFGRGIKEHEFLKPDGGAIKYALPFVSGWGTGLALTQEGNVLLVREPKPARLLVTGTSYGWECPAGAFKTSPGKTHEELFRQAILAETGYEPEYVVRVGPEAPMLPASRTLEAGVQLFLATGCRKVAEPRARPPGEEIELRVVPLEEWVEECLLKPTVNECGAVLATAFALLTKLGWRLVPRPPRATGK